MSAVIISHSAKETLDLGKLLGSALEPGDVVLLTGELGAGKTQLTKGIALGLGITRSITSPTFTIVYEYLDEKTEQVVLRHFDLYRLDKEAELDDIDYFGLLEDKAISVVEWGDKFPQALPLEYLLVSFELLDENRRKLCCKAEGGRGKKLLYKIAEAMPENRGGAL